MNCGDLAITGFPVAAFVLLAASCLLLGVLLHLVPRIRRARSAVIMALLVGGALTTGALGAASARAVAPDCVVGGSDGGGSGVDPVAITVSLTITQTSTMSGLAPNIAPAPITGVIVNDGTDSSYVTAITVQITSVSKAPGAVPGPCDASDYVLRGATMPLGRTVAPNGGSAAFGGASIGFWNKSINQDACQGAEITLGYTSS